jgi:general secretion pathway protein D
MALAGILAAVCLASFPAHAQSAKSFFKRGETAEAKEDYDTAFEDYSKAYAKAPKDLTYRTALYRVRITASAEHVTQGRKMLRAGNEQGALAEFLHASEIDPGNEAPEQEIARIRDRHGEAPPAEAESSLPEAAGAQAQIDSMGSPAELKPMSNEPLTMHYSEDAKVVYQAIGKAAGINVLFDPDYNSKRIQVDLVNSSLLDALRIVGTMSNTFWRPVTSNSIFVAQNTRAKRTELDEQAVQTFYLSNAWQQNDLNDVQTALRNVLPNAKVYGVASQNAIVMRATPDELLLAQKLVNDLDKSRPEVVVDIGVLEVSKNWERTLGISWPSSVGVALQPPTTSTTTTGSTGTCSDGTNDCNTSTSGTSPSLYDLAHLKATDFAVTIGSATANLLLTDSNTKILQNPRIRATDSQKATMKIGSKIPIATGSYGGGGLGGVGGVGGIGIGVQTQFQYQDVGVNIEVTPTVHYDHDITIKIKIEVTSQSGSVTISGVTEPILSQRVVEQVIRLREGEANILGGIQDRQDQTSWTGIPGLSSIPILKYLFGSKDHTINDDEIVFLVVPHIVRTQQLDQVNLRTIDTGVGQAIELRHTSADGPGAAPNRGINPSGLPPGRPSASARPGFGPIPGQTAMAAAPAALAQLRQAGDSGGDPNPPAAPVTPPGAPPAGAANPAGQRVNFTLAAPDGPVAAGSTFKVPVVLSGGSDIVSVPFEVQYDADKLELVGVSDGDLLSRDGRAAGLSHREDIAGGKSTVTINASRPQGAPGVSGPGVVCLLNFRAKAPGASEIAVTRPGAITSAQQPLPADGGRVSIQVQ